MNVSGGSTDNYLLIGLEMEATYTISIVAVSEHLPSDSIDQEVTLGMVGALYNKILNVCPVLTITILFVSRLSPRSAKCECGLHNSQLHLPLLECSQ